MAPIGTQVRVVNQPFVFGWHDGALHIQAFDVLEDDPRDWKKAQAEAPQQGAGRAHPEGAEEREPVQLGSAAIAELAQDPRGLPVSITNADAEHRRAARRGAAVENRVPDGANWDGGRSPRVPPRTTCNRWCRSAIRASPRS